MLRFACLLIIICYFFPIRLQAEKLFPLLNKTSLDSVQTMLQKSRADTSRVNLLLLLLLGQDFILKSKADQAYNYWQKAKTLSDNLNYRPGQIRAKFLLSQIEAFKGNNTKAKSLATAGIQVSKQEKNLLLEAEGWYYLGEAYTRSKEEISQKIKCFEQSMRLYRQTGNTAKEAFLLKSIADNHFNQGKPDQSVRELLQALSLYRSINYAKLHYTYDLLVAVNRNLGNYKEAIEFSLLSIENATTTKDTSELPLFYGRLGLIYDEINQFQDGMRYHQKAISQYQRENNRLMTLNITLHITLNLLAQRKPEEALAFCLKTIKAYPPDSRDASYAIVRALAESYKALKQYKPAEKYYLEMYEIEETRSAKDINVYLSIATFYITFKQFNKARRYLDKATQLYARQGPLHSAVTLELLLFKEDSAQGNYQEAMVHHQRYKLLNDSVFNETKSKQIASLQVQYDTKEKEQNIALLTKQNLVQQASIRQRELQRNVTIIGAVTLLLLTGVIYNRYRLKQQSNRLLEAKQLEINQKNYSLVQVLMEKEELLE